MSLEIVSQTAQGTALSMGSNILAQVISSYKNNVPLALNPAPVVKFALFSIISNPPNIAWQTFLEDAFPTNVSSNTPGPKSEKANGEPLAQKSESQISKTNIMIKFLLDMTIGAVLNNLMFLVFMAYMSAPAGGKEGTVDFVQQDVNRKFWPLLASGLKVWPLVSLVNFLFVPVNKRVLVGALVGVGWNIYLSLLVG